MCNNALRKKADLTVVVPIYNVEKYLKKCVESIEHQTIFVDCIILVDDGSTDSSGEIADSLAEQFDNITVIHHQVNGGLSAARNTGLDQAKTKYVTFVDSDDYVDSGMYENLLNMLNENDADISIGGVWREEESGEKSSIYAEGIFKTWNKGEALIELNSYSYFNMSFCDKIFKCSLFESTAYGKTSLRFPIGKTCEDYYLMHQVVARAEKIVYTSTPFYHYVQRTGSITRNSKVNMGQIEASLAQLEFYQNWFPDLTYVAETACCFSHMGIYSAYTRKGIKCPHELLEKMRKVSRKYLKSVLKNNSIPKIKKAQAIAFCYCIPVYAAVIGRTKHR